MRAPVHGMGAIVLIAYVVQTIASYWLAPAMVMEEQGWAGKGVFYPGMTGVGAVPQLMSGVNFAAIYCLPTLAATAVCALLLLVLTARTPPEDLPDVLFRWSVAFAAVSLPALPVLAQDFWLSAGWGEMITRGLNPYHQDMPQDLVDGWIPDTYLMHMTYGPLWALISAAVMLASGDRWVAFVLFKIVLGAFWLGALVLTRRLTRGEDARTQCLAMVTVGWLPLGVVQTLGEGHNDVVMAVFVLLWLHTRNAAALAAAFGAKYLAAPLALLALLDRRKIVELAMAAVLGAGLLALFFRGLSYFDGYALMREWRFMTPRAALAFLGPAAPLAGVPFLALAGLEAWRFVRERSDDSRVRAAVAVLALILLAVMPYLWPWYLLLVLLPAATRPAWAMSVWLTGLALAAPFVLVVHVRLGQYSDTVVQASALALYASAFVWLGLSVLVRRRFAAPAPRLGAAGAAS